MDGFCFLPPYAEGGKVVFGVRQALEMISIKSFLVGTYGHSSDSHFAYMCMIWAHQRLGLLCVSFVSQYIPVNDWKGVLSEDQAPCKGIHTSPPRVDSSKSCLLALQRPSGPNAKACFSSGKACPTGPIWLHMCPMRVTHMGAFKPIWTPHGPHMDP